MTSNGDYYLLSACKDGKPMLRNGKTGDWVGTFTGHKGAVWGARLTGEADRAVTGSSDFTAKIWDTYEGQELHSFVHEDVVRAVDISRSGTHVITSSRESKRQESTVSIFDLNRPDAGPSKILNPQGVVKSMVYHEAYHAILTASDDGNVRIWDSRSLNVQATIHCHGTVSFLDRSADGRTVSWGTGQNAYFWDPTSGGPSDVVQHQLGVSVAAVALHPSHNRFVAGGDKDFWVHIHGYENNEELAVYKGHHGPIHAVSFSPDGELYATGSEDGTIRLWQTDPTKPYGLWQLTNGDVQ